METTISPSRVNSLRFGLIVAVCNTAGSIRTYENPVPWWKERAVLEVAGVYSAQGTRLHSEKRCWGRGGAGIGWKEVTISLWCKWKWWRQHTRQEDGSFSSEPSCSAKFTPASFPTLGITAAPLLYSLPHHTPFNPSQQHYRSSLFFCPRGPIGFPPLSVWHWLC